MENEVKQENTSKKGGFTTSELISFAFDIGWSIALPLVALVLGGRILDRHFDTAPWLMIAGLLLSIVSTTIIIWKKIKKII